MADPKDPTHKPEGPGNHPRTSTIGGASAFPTPANNAGGGAGWGDKGFFKGGSDGQGPGHANVLSLVKPPYSTLSYPNLSNPNPSIHIYTNNGVDGGDLGTQSAGNDRWFPWSIIAEGGGRV